MATRISNLAIQVSANAEGVKKGLATAQKDVKSFGASLAAGAAGGAIVSAVLQGVEKLSQFAGKAKEAIEVIIEHSDSLKKHTSDFGAEWSRLLDVLARVLEGPLGMIIEAMSVAVGHAADLLAYWTGVSAAARDTSKAIGEMTVTTAFAELTRLRGEYAEQRDTILASRMSAQGQFRALSRLDREWQSRAARMRDLESLIARGSHKEIAAKPIRRTSLGDLTEPYFAMLDTMSSKAKSLFEATRAPIEKLNERLAETRLLLGEKLIDEDTAMRSLRRIAEDFEGLAPKEDAKPISLVDRMSAAAFSIEAAFRNRSDMPEKWDKISAEESRKHTRILEELLRSEKGVETLKVAPL